jgi:putative serine protease PepD
MARRRRSVGSGAGVLRRLLIPLLGAVAIACTPQASPSPAAPGATGATGAPAGSGAIASGLASPGQGAASNAPSLGGSSALDQLEAEYVAIVQRVSPSVVVIESQDALGSGVIFDSTGDVITNAHVVGDADTFVVTLADGRQAKGSLVGTFPPNDVAVVRIDASNLQAATFGDSSKVRVGQIALAVGNPLGLQSSVTNGIISSVGRTVVEPGGATLPGLIQTSAPINPGNSGGALVNARGEVIGIPTLAAVDPNIGAAAPGIGFAIPSNDAADFAKQMITSGRVTNSHRAYLAIRSADVSGAQGVLVYAVVRGGPADQAGIEPGELIVSIEGKPTPDSATLSVVLASLQPGQRVQVVLRSEDGSQRTVPVALGEIPG